MYSDCAGLLPLLRIQDGIISDIQGAVNVSNPLVSFIGNGSGTVFPCTFSVSFSSFLLGFLLKLRIIQRMKNGFFSIRKMHPRSLLGMVCFLLLTAELSGCGAAASSSPDLSSMKGTRDHTPSVLVPEASGEKTLGTGDAILDISHTEDGYFCASYSGSSAKVKLQAVTSDGITYTYDLPVGGSMQVFPFSDGSGDYDIGIYTNVEETLYATEYQTTLSVSLSDEYLPFLYPNQYVWFTKDSAAVAKAAEITSPADTDLDAVTLVYDYVTSHVTYDWDKAKNVETGYLPDVDRTLSEGKGICFDYASLMAAMLRSQRIPTRLEIGYAGTAWHAWISTYISDIGWVNGIIRFDGTDWSLMDPTLAANESTKELKKYISDGSEYRTCYLY